MTSPGMRLADFRLSEGHNDKNASCDCFVTVLDTPLQSLLVTFQLILGKHLNGSGAD